MNFIKRLLKGFSAFIRNLFIKEKKKYISARTYDNINFNFKNLQLYSEIGIYKTIISLFFIVIFLCVVIYFLVLDFKMNVYNNKELVETKPLELTISSPIDIDLPQDYKEVIYKIKRGDTLSGILTNIVKISQSDANACINELKTIYNIKNLRIGQKLFIKYRDSVKLSNDVVSKNIELKELRIIDDNLLEKITVSGNSSGVFFANKEKIVLSKTYNKYVVDISNSVYVDAVSAGVPVEIVLRLINYYSFDVDFQRDIRKGDWLEVVFEAFYTDNGKKVRNGEIIYSNLHVNSRDNKLYKFNDGNNNYGYFNENGISTQKSLLRTPINGARISSGYNNGRKHPVLGYTTAHKGIDFAAPIGTPFYAAGNGTVKKIIIGCKNGDRYCGGGFGNYISIQHSNSYITEYAHISRIESGLRVGSKVKQGDVIAYVGTTGLSTGPHLHYGVIFNGERINPAKIKSIPLKKLSGKSLLEFVDTKDTINSLRATAINQNLMEVN